MNLVKYYKKMPLFLQDWVVTVKNIFVYYKKYRAIPFIRPIGKICKKLRDNKELIYNDTKELERIQKLTEHAKSYTAHYKKVFENLSKFDSIEVFKQEAPILKKQTIRTNSEEFVSTQANSWNSTNFRTSGSTGSPLKGKIKISDLQNRFIIILKSMVDFGIDFGKKYGRFPGADVADERRVYRKDLLNQHYIFSIFQLSESNVEKYYNAIQHNKIEILEAYPSVLYTLAKLFEQSGLIPNCVLYVATTAEKLHGFQKEKIEEVFSCKVFDYYGSSEQSSYIFTCSQGRMHNSNIISTLEVLDENGKEVENGEEGQMVVTSFTSTYTPLIRYEIGDRCIKSKKQRCNCGKGGLIIEEIIGRDEDIFKTLSGKYITRFSLVLKYLPEKIINSQLVLSNKKCLATVFYTYDNGEIPKEKFDVFKKKLLNMIGEEYDIEYKHTVAITKSARGKVRAVIIEQ